MTNSNDTHVISYLELRKILGALGFFLPTILVIGTAIFSTEPAFQESISHYYFTVMHDVFVFILSSFGLFLIAYRGYEGSSDNLLSNIAGGCALLVAFFPTSIDDCNAWSCRIHFICATSFFVMLAYMSYFQFTKSDKPESEWTSQKHKRNVVYKTCAIIMISSILILAVHMLIWEIPFLPYNSTYIFETAALMAFGVSWVVKGKAFLKDQ